MNNWPRPSLRAVIVCVEYGDILGLTLPYNVHHFDEVTVITTIDDVETQQVVKQLSCKPESPPIGMFFTDAFYRRGADFNKWLALEEGLDAFGRHGLMCLMDADVLWPKHINHEPYQRGVLYSPPRRLWLDVRDPTPREPEWYKLPACKDFEWAGYTQIFHADDPHLPPPPWHNVNWRHAGGADSEFQRRWPPTHKMRPNWEVLHLGLPGRNWCGRSTVRTDGTTPAEAAMRAEQLRNYLSVRGSLRSSDPYKAERLDP